MNELISLEQRPLTGGNGEFESDLFARWIGYIDASPKTVQTYTRAVRQFGRWLAERGVKNPCRDDIIAYRDDLKADHKPTTVQAYLMAVKQFFSWTAAEGLYPNVAQHVKGVKLEAGFKRDCFTSAQVVQLLGQIDTSSPKGLRDYAMIALMVTTGLRTVEIERANVEDLRTLGGFTALYIQGKGREDRTEYVKVEQPVEEAIRAYLKTRSGIAGKSPLFASDARRNAGERLTTRSISRIAKERMEAAGLESAYWTAHSLRHTAATLNLLNGGTVEETQQLLRHKSINTTMIYSHALERAGNMSECRIASAIFR